jgi:hypothetical protein
MLVVAAAGVAVVVAVAAAAAVVVAAVTNPGRRRVQLQDQRMAAHLWVPAGSVPASGIGLYQTESHRPTATFHAGVHGP